MPLSAPDLLDREVVEVVRGAVEGCVELDLLVPGALALAARPLERPPALHGLEGPLPGRPEELHEPARGVLDALPHGGNAGRGLLAAARRAPARERLRSAF